MVVLERGNTKADVVFKEKRYSFRPAEKGIIKLMWLILIIEDENADLKDEWDRIVLSYATEIGRRDVM